MIEGEAKAYHIRLSNQLAEQFNLEPVLSRINPHFTLKTPFETENIDEVETIVETFVKREKCEPITLTGFSDFFKRNVIYMSAEAPKQTYMLIRRLQDQLRSISWLKFQSNEFPIILHATLCYTKNVQQSKRIISLLLREKPFQFNLLLDSITLLQKDEGKWNLVRTFRIMQNH